LLATLEGAAEIEVTFDQQDLAARIPHNELPGLFSRIIHAVPVVESPRSTTEVKKLATVMPRVLHTPQTLAGVYNIYRPNNGNITPR